MATPGQDDAAGDLRAVAGCFEAAPALLFAFTGPDHVVAALNAAARAFMGDRPDSVGRPLREVCPEYAGQQLFEALDRVLASGQAEQAREWRIQLDQDGDGRLEERFVDFTLVPWTAPGGVAHGVAGVAHDVTGGVLARRADAAAAELRYRAARDAVETLQDALLPADLPVLPGYRLAARYLVAGAEQGAGGDWFDALTLDDGRLVLVVGDVVGHGVCASVVMSQLRAVLLELLTSGADLVHVLARLGRFVARVPGGHGATVCVVALDQVTGTFEYATCGHPPPLVVARGPTRRRAALPAADPRRPAGRRGTGRVRRPARAGGGSRPLLGRSRRAIRPAPAARPGRAGHGRRGRGRATGPSRCWRPCPCPSGSAARSSS